MTHLFVYGTLKRGCKNHRHLAGQRYLGDARTVAGYRLYDLGDYPGLIADATDSEGVAGEVWLVSAPALARLDEFEGVAEGLYRREPVKLPGPFEQTNVQTYLYNRDPGTRRIGDTWSE